MAPRQTDTRERIVTAARQLFAEKGFDGATTAGIARRVGIAEGTIYRHFADKKELFLACVTPAVEEAVDRGLENIQSAPDLRSMVRGMLEARVHLLEENLDSFNILVTEAPHHPELAQMFLERVFLSRSDRVLPVMQRLVSSGELRRRPNMLILGLGLTMAIWGMITFRDRLTAIASRYPVPITHENLLEDLTDFVLYGIAGQPPGGED